jgi:hypothetical protein
VFIADILCGVQVSVQGITTTAAKKQRLGTTITTMLITTLRAGLGRVARVNRNYTHSSFLSFVLQEGAQLTKGPGVQLSLTFTPTRTSALTDFCEILNDNSSARWGRLDDMFRQYMVTVAVESHLLARQLAKVAVGGLSSFRLQCALESKVSFVNILPMPLTQEATFRSNGRSIETEVYTNNFLTIGTISSLYMGQTDNNMQPETTLAVEKVSRSSWIAYISKRVRRDGETNTHPALRRGEISFLLGPIYFVGVKVIAGWTRLRTRLRNTPALLLTGERTLDSFSGLDAGLDNQIRYKPRAFSFDRIVCGVMQVHAVALIVSPAIFAHQVERSCELGKGLSERLGLLKCGFKFEPHSSIHALSIPYIRSFCNVKEDAAPPHAPRHGEEPRKKPMAAR